MNTTTIPTTRTEIVDALNDWDANRRHEDIWEGLIHQLEGFDWDRTEELDPTYRSNVFSANGVDYFYHEGFGWVAE